MGRGRGGRGRLPVVWAVALCGLARIVRADLPPRHAEDQPQSSTPSRTAPREADVPDVNPLPAAPTSSVPGAGAVPAAGAPEGPGTRAAPAGDPVPRGLPITLAAALQLAGVNPLDIAPAT